MMRKRQVSVPSLTRQWPACWPGREDDGVGGFHRVALVAEVERGAAFQEKHLLLLKHVEMEGAGLFSRRQLLHRPSKAAPDYISRARRGRGARTVFRRADGAASSIRSTICFT